MENTKTQQATLDTWHRTKTKNTTQRHSRQHQTHDTEQKKIQHRDTAGNIRHMTQNKDKKIQHRDRAGNIRHMTQNKDKKIQHRKIRISSRRTPPKTGLGHGYSRRVNSSCFKLYHIMLCRVCLWTCCGAHVWYILTHTQTFKAV